MDFWDKHFWWGIAGAGALLIIVSAVADRRRQKRRNVNKVGFMPWTGITVLAVMVALMATAIAIKMSL
jgi:acetyl esterase/lipase